MALIEPVWREIDRPWAPLQANSKRGNLFTLSAHIRRDAAGNLRIYDDERVQTSMLVSRQLLQAIDKLYGHRARTGLFEASLIQAVANHPNAEVRNDSGEALFTEGVYDVPEHLRTWTPPEGETQPDHVFYW